MKSESYRNNQLKTNFKVGDKVIIFKKANSYENDWGLSWHSDMNQFIGKTITIIEINDYYGIRFENGYEYWWVPYFILKNVRLSKLDRIL